MLKRSIIRGVISYGFIIFGVYFYFHPSNVSWFIFALAVVGPIALYPARVTCDSWTDIELIQYSKHHELLPTASFAWLQDSKALTDLRALVQYHLDINQ